MKSLLDVPDNLREPLSEENTKLYISCTMVDLQKINPFTKEHSVQLKDSGMILFDRLWGGTQISVPVAAIITILAGGNPGVLVLWAYTLFCMYKEKGSIITMSDLSDTFPLGFPTKTGSLQIWDAQKGERGGNLLDDPNNWKVD